MTFLETVERARAFLERNRRVSLRALQREFDLDEDTLEEVAEELTEVQRIAVRDGRVLAWAGSEPSPPIDVRDTAREPRDYTPKHLADKILQSKSALEGERKQVTVMFVDLARSMELAEGLDPEAWHRVLDRFFQILAEGVHRFEGTINQYTGDGIMALFGAPIAHEDHAQRACYAALQLRKDLRGYADELRRTEGLSLSTRIGLNSGEVIVGRIGDDLRMDYTAQGLTVGLAQRMEQRAAADSAYLTEHTARLVEGYFALRDLGEFDLKGASDPLRVFELEDIGKARTRLERSRARGFAKFVGREREMASLDGALEDAIAGNGRVLGVVAEAGTGKSRLCTEFVERCRGRGIQVNEGHCPAHGKTVPYLPLLEILRDIFEIEDRDSDHEARRKITGELMLLDDKFHGMLPLLFEFLGVPDPARPAPQMSPEGRQQQLFGFVRHLQQARSDREPTVILLDDLHWIDQGSDAFLAHAVDAAQGHRTLLLVNFRPEYHADWMTRSYYQQIALQPLGRDAIELLLANLVGSHESLASLAERVYSRTGGNPFFVEEVVQSLIESGSLEGARGSYRLTAPIDTLEIPATVQSVLAARIDRLPEREKRLLQTASVIEKEFPESILKRVAELPEADLAASLAALLRGEFLLEKALYPEIEYTFKHPLTQEVAYRSLLGERREQLHAAVAKAIEEVDSQRLDERAALLAYHWENAGERLLAASWHARAARWAGLDNPAESLRHWNSVWEILAGEVESPESTAMRIQAAQELLKLGLRQGLSMDDVEHIFVEGKRIAEASGDRRAIVTLLVNYAKTAHMLTGAPRLGLPSLHEAIEVAGSDDKDATWAAHEALATTLNYLGESEAALRHMDEMLKFVDGDFGIGVEVASFGASFTYSTRGWSLTDLGRYAEAADSFSCADEAARRMNESEVVSWNDGFRARMLARAGDSRGALAAGSRSVAIAEELGSLIAIVNAYWSHGLALMLEWEWEASRDRIAAALEIARANRVWLTMEGDALASLAEAELGLGDADEALRISQLAVSTTVRSETPTFELHARLVCARILVALEGAAAEAEAQRELDRAEELLQSTGARSYAPAILEERAGLSDALGRSAKATELRRDALGLYREMGATGHAERLARVLENL